MLDFVVFSQTVPARATREANDGTAREGSGQREASNRARRRRLNQPLHLTLLICCFPIILSGCGGTVIGVSTKTAESNSASSNLSINQGSVEFGNVPLNTTATQSVALASSGTGTVTVNSATLTGAGFTLPGASFPVTLSPGQTLALKVQFNPFATGAAAGQLIISSDSSTGSTAAIPLSGTGTTAPTTISELSCSNASITGSGTDSCQVTLSEAAPVGGLMVNLVSNNSAVTVPDTATVPSGASSAPFMATVASVATAQSATITASLSADPGTFTLQLNPVVTSGPTAQVAGRTMPTIVWQAPAAIPYGTALGSTQLDATALKVAGTFSYSPAAGSVLTAGVHTITATFTPTDTIDYAIATSSVSITVNAITPTITWPTPAAITFGTALGGAQLDASSTVAGTFSYSPAAGTVLAAGAHTITATFTPTDTTDYSTATSSVSITVNNTATSTITWPTPAAITYGTALGSAQLDATSTVAGTFSYSPAAGTVLTAGTHTITTTFTPTNTATYPTATSSVSITVSAVTPTITWTAPATIGYGTALSNAQLDATSATAGTFSYSPAAGTVLTKGAHSITATFTPTDTTDYATVASSVTITVNAVSPTIAWPTPAAITYGTTLSGSQLDATSTVAGTFSYSPAAGTVLTKGAHTITATFTPTDTTDYATATSSVSITVNAVTPTINWPAPAAIPYGTALGGTQLDATSGVPGSFSYSPVAGTLLNSGSHTITATFTPTDAIDYTAATGSVSITVNAVTPTITWAAPSAISYGTALSSTQLDATSGVAGSFGYSPSAGTVLTSGSHTITATFTPADTTDYTTATSSVSIHVNGVTPTITWPAPAAINYGTALGSAQLDAASTVAGAFSYSPAAGTVLTKGTHTITATFAPTDTTDYATATSSVSITVNAVTPTMNWPAPAAITYGTALGGAQLDASSTVAGTFSYSPAAGTVLAAGTHTITATFTPTDTTDYAIATSSVSITVNAVTPTITWPAPAAISYGTSLTGTQLDANSTVAGTFSYSPAAGTLLAAGSHTISATFTPTDTTDYATATSSVSITVNKVTPTITWPNPVAIIYGTALNSAQLDATSTAAGTFIYSPVAGTVLTAGTHTVTATFTPTDTTDYATATSSVSITVNKVTPTITWPNPAAISYGTALGGTQLDASSTVAGNFSYSPSAGTVLTAGAHTITATFTPTDTTDYATATSSVSITVNKVTPTITWPAPAAIPYGTALGGTQLDATSIVAGTFSYSPAVGTVLTAGTHTITAFFTPTDTTDYATATSSVSITVNKITPTVAWPTPAAIVYGTALSSAQLDATSTVAGTFSYSPAAGTVLTAGAHTITATFTPTDTTDYATAMDSVSITVNNAATPTITWPTPAAITYGVSLGGAQLDATSIVAGTFSYSPAVGTVLTAGAHTITATFAPTDTTDYTTATSSVSITVNKVTPTITWLAPAAIPYGTSLGGTQLDATSTVAGAFSYSPAAGTLLTKGAHTITATFTPTDTTDYATDASSVLIMVNSVAPTITWPVPAAITYGTALSVTQLDATSTVAGMFSYSPAAGTVLSSGAHTITATFAPTDTTDYTTATSSVSITVNKAAPSITWATPAAIAYGSALSGTQLDATSTIAGAFSYSPAAGTVLSSGSQTITATFTPTDSTDYATATSSVSITVNKVTPTITWSTPAAINYGTALSSAQLDASSTVAGTFSYSPAPGMVLTAGTHTLTATFSPTDTTDYPTATSTVSITVNAVTPTITWPAPAAISYGTALGGTQLDASSTVAGTFSYSPAAGTVLTAGTHTLTATLTPTDTTDYPTATSTVSITVNAVTPTITWPAPAAISYGTALGGTQLDASSTVAGTFSYSPAAGNVLAAGTHTLTATFTPTDTTDYPTATSTVSITVNAVTPTITWPAPAAISYGTALGGTQLDASSTVAGMFSYSPAAGTVLAAGSHTLTATFTPTDGTDYPTATSTVSITVNTVTPTITWPAPAAISYGTALGGTQLDASSTVAGMFSYSPAAGTVLSTGSHTLTATFTPTDTTNYATATASVSITVGAVTPAADRYIAQSAAGGNTGADCADARALSSLTSSDWTAGNTIHLCGTISTSITALGSGTSGNPITILFDTGAKMSKGTWYVSGQYGYAIKLFNVNYITINGGTTCGWVSRASVLCNGIIEDTLNGTAGGVCPGGTCTSQNPDLGIYTLNCNYCIVENLLIRNLYVRTAVNDAAVNFGNNDAVLMNGTNDSVNNNTIHDAAGGAIFSYPNGATNLSFYNNEEYNINHSFVLSASGNITAGDVYHHDNYIHDMEKWDNLQVPGSVTSGTFVVGETVLQSTTNVTAVVALPVASNGPLWLTNEVGSSYGTYVWTGQTSGAVFTPSGAIQCPIYHNSAIHAFGVGSGGVWPSVSQFWIYNNNFGPNPGLCPTAWVFLEGNPQSGGYTPWTGSSGTAYVFNNIALGSSVQINNGTGHVVANNTILGSNLQVTGSTGLPIAAATVENNYVSGGGTQINGQFIAANQNVTSLLMDYNVYADTWGYNLWFYPPNKATGSWTTYMANQSTWDQHSVNDTCTFGGPCLTANQGGVSQTTGVPSSEASTVKAGANLTSLNITALDSDLNGVARPSTGAWDIGAYQFVQATQGTGFTLNDGTITWPTPAAITYGTALSSTQLDANSTVAGTFSYSPTAGTVLTAGTHTVTATFTPTDITDYATATGSVSVTVVAATPTITWPTPAAINYGTALGSVQLDATSTVAGTFSYSPSAGTVLASGTHTITATFTPTDTADYSTATSSVTITVNAALNLLSCSIGTITGAGTDTCTVTLTGAAPSGGFTVNLSSSSNSAVTVPSTVTIPAGAASAQFTATASPVTTTQTVTITASTGTMFTSFTMQLNATVLALSINPANVAFGNVVVNTTTTQQITLTSTGTAPVTINGTTLTGAGFTMSGPALPITLTPNQATTVDITFDPAAASVDTGQLTISSNASANNAALVGLTGTGLATVAVTPASASTTVGTAQQFAATVTGTSNTAVTWTVSGTGCSGTTCGIISSTGLYVAPAAVPSPATVAITATSVSAPTQSASATVTIAPSVDTTYYLAPASAGGNDSNNGLSPNTPWLTPNHSVNCGDVILATASTAYSASNFGSGKWGTVTCNAGNNVAWLECATFDACKISASSASPMVISASYWGVQGWEVTNSGNNTNYKCISVSPLTSSAIIHHVIIADNIVNGCQANGIGTANYNLASVDYVAIIGNIVYRAAQSNAGGYAGISIYQPVASDSLAGTHIYIAGNFTWDNVSPSTYDGEGISLNTLDGSQGQLPLPYSQQVVVDNNISFLNGSSGVNVAGGGNTAAPVFIRHNTLYGNNTQSSQNNPNCGEILFAGSPNQIDLSSAFSNLAMTSAATGGSCGTGNPKYVLSISNGDSTDTFYSNFGYSAMGADTQVASSPGFSFAKGNLFGSNPDFVSVSDPGSPQCSGTTSVPGCMATVISNFTPTNVTALAYGYQMPSSAQTNDPLFPEWLCNVNLPAGLVSVGCNTVP